MEGVLERGQRRRRRRSKSPKLASTFTRPPEQRPRQVELPVHQRHQVIAHDREFDVGGLAVGRRRLRERVEPSVMQPAVERHVEVGHPAADRTLDHVLGAIRLIDLVELGDELGQCRPALLDACHGAYPFIPLRTVAFHISSTPRTSFNE
ncbi:hypothetical protein GCM10020001_008980 [Nonomuraea salmonea]